MKKEEEEEEEGEENGEMQSASLLRRRRRPGTDYDSQGKLRRRRWRLPRDFFLSLSSPPPSLAYFHTPSSLCVWRRGRAGQAGSRARRTPMRDALALSQTLDEGRRRRKGEGARMGREEGGGYLLFDFTLSLFTLLRCLVH